MTEETNDNHRSESKLVDSIKIEGLGDLVQEYTELGLDTFTDEGILKDIPIVGTIVKAAKAVGSIRDWFYLKKIICFLQKVGETTQEQRQKFIDDNCADTKQFEEAVLLVLEQADRFEKTTLIGKIFKACILGKIRYEDAIILSEMVNRAYWSDLTSMFECRELKDQEQRLFLSGLFEMDKNTSIDEIGALKVKRNDYAFALQLIAGENYNSLDGCALGILCK